MNRTNVILFTVFGLLLSFCQVKAQVYTPPPSMYTAGLKFCEGSVAYQNKILISNFGTDTLNPLNNEGKGYIIAIENGKVKPFIKADGFMCAPKGMTIVGRHLFVADVQKVLVYDLHKLGQKPVVINFPEGNKFVNDIIAVGDLLIVSVTDSGKLFGIDISNMDIISFAVPTVVGDVPGANGLALFDNLIYVASYNPKETPETENVIYVANIFNPNAPLRKLITDLPAGQYDGIALNNDGTKIYFSAWSTKENPKPAIYIYNLVNKTAARIVDLGVTFGGPADITVKNGVIWIPDLPNSRVFRFEL